MRRKIIIGILILLFILSAVFTYFYLQKPTVTLIKELTAEINTDHQTLDYIKKVEKGKIISKNKKLDTTSLGKKEIKIKLQNFLTNKFPYKYTITIIDTIAPQITYTKEIKITEGTKTDLLKDVKVTDNSNEQITPTVEGTYDFNKPGNYKLKYVAEDSSHNKTEEEFTLIVNKKIVPKQTTPTTYNSTPKQAQAGYPYYIKVNRSNNVIMVYAIENGQYQKLVKVFTGSASTKTPLGVFRTSNKYVWKVLIGPVWGQYATRITGQVLFHSVPYLKQTKDSLEYWEYNQLGVHRSLGCIRLMVIDAKWIYDNCPLGTTVEIYDGPLNGVAKPATPKIDTNSPNRGWDPTDPDPNNPWKAG